MGRSKQLNTSRKSHEAGTNVYFIGDLHDTRDHHSSREVAAHFCRTRVFERNFLYAWNANGTTPREEEIMPQPLQPGDRVLVVGGAWINFSGVIDEIVPNQLGVYKVTLDPTPGYPSGVTLTFDEFCLMFIRSTQVGAIATLPCANTPAFKVGDPVQVTAPYSKYDGCTGEIKTSTGHLFGVELPGIGIVTMGPAELTLLPFSPYHTAGSPYLVAVRPQTAALAVGDIVTGSNYAGSPITGTVKSLYIGVMGDACATVETTPGVSFNFFTADLTLVSRVANARTAVASLPKECQHAYVRYEGFTDAFDYCKMCNKKKDT